MNHGYSRVSTPVLRNPCLFRHNYVRPTPAYYPTHQNVTHLPIINAYPYTPSLHTHQSQYAVQSPLPYSPPSYSHLPASPRFPAPSSVPSLVPYSSYSVPTFSYAPTSSSKGLVIILIATLILVALDLVIVRPQKSRSEVRTLP